MMFDKLRGRKRNGDAPPQKDQRELEKVKDRVSAVELRVDFLETQLGVIKPIEEGK